MSGENTVSSDEKAREIGAGLWMTAAAEPRLVMVKEADWQRVHEERDRARSVAVALEQELARKDQALDEIRALHKPERIVTVGGSDEMCAHCRVRPKNAYDVAWPCATQRILSDLAAALDAHLNKEDDSE